MVGLRTGVSVDDSADGQGRSWNDVP
jgi:hypothetical protein